jgi:hypothetical protein
VRIRFLSGSPRPPKNASFRTIHSSPATLASPAAWKGRKSGLMRI